MDAVAAVRRSVFLKLRRDDAATDAALASVTRAREIDADGRRGGDDGGGV